MSQLQDNLEYIYLEVMEKLIPENIKKDVTILGITGTYEGGESGGYTRLEYIQGTGTQWIDTGINPSSSIVSQLKFSVSTIGQIIIGSHFTEPKTFRMFFANNQWYLDYGSGENYNRINGGNYSLNTVYDVEVGNRYIKNLTTGTNIISSTAIGNFTYSDMNIGIFASTEHHSNITRGKIYYCKIYDNGALVRDLIPVKRNSDNAVCLYDKITKQFFTNSGTGNFTAGPVITELEYIQSTGTQYIDTNTTTARRFVGKVNHPVNENMTYLFGSQSSNYEIIFRDDGSSYYTRESQNSNLKDAYPNLIIDADFEFDIDYTNNTWTVGSQSGTFNDWTFTASINSIYLLARNYGSAQNLGKFKIYEFKMYDSDDILVRDFVPIKDRYNVVCLYDKVSGTYFYNAGTGTFIAGPEVE